MVLTEASLELQAGETVGLVGANGSGKTTLFRLIAGEIQPDKGTITRARGLEIGLLKQDPDISPDRTLHDEVGSAFADLLALERRLHDLSDQMASCTDEAELAELMEGYERVNAQFITKGGHNFETRLNEILGGLGFVSTDYNMPMSQLSGGQKCRAALAKLLLKDPRFLLLDEPTNHLDIDAVSWLERFLAGHHGGTVIISHDRYLLDRLCDRIAEVEGTRVTAYPGNYTIYAKTKALQALTLERQFERDAAFIRKEREFIARNIYARRTKDARGRRKRLERRLEAGEFVTDAPRRVRSAKFRFETSDSSSAGQAADVVRCDEISMRFGDNVLFENLNVRVPIGERFGLTGPNGTGKTTLLRILLGELAPTSGEFALDPRVTVGYYAQEHVTLELDRTIVEQIRIARPEFSEHDARSYLARFRFTGDDVFKTLGMLSGGEQSRVRLATLILERPDVLILDEPTNHLDIPSRETLEEALLEFPGTIIVVSHDRYFLDRVVDRLLVIRLEGHAIYDGNYSYYVQQIEQEQIAARATKTGVEREQRRQRRQLEDDARQTGPSPYDRLSVEELEEMVIERETALAALHERFGTPEVYKDPSILEELKDQIREVEEELSEIDAAWQERADTS